MFENFTPAAIRAIAAALQSAQTFGHKSTSAAHLLFGLVAHECLAQTLLAQEGIKAEAVENQLIEIYGKLPPASKVDIPFETSAKMALQQAQVSRQALGNAQLNSGHILLGLVTEPECQANQIITLLGGSIQQLINRTPEAITRAVQTQDFEVLPEQTFSREEQLSKFAQWARSTPNWKIELKLAVEAAGLCIADAEQRLLREW